MSTVEEQPNCNILNKTKDHFLKSPGMKPVTSRKLNKDDLSFQYRELSTRKIYLYEVDIVVSIDAPTILCFVVEYEQILVIILGKEKSFLLSKWTS